MGVPAVRRGRAARVWPGCFVLAWLAACGSASVAAAQASPTRPFRPGELATYQVEFSGIGVGSGSIRVDTGEVIAGAPTWRLIFAVRGGIPFFRINDVMESWFDPIALVSHRFTQELREGPKRYSRHFDLLPAERRYVERGQAPAQSVAEPLDDASFLFFVRTQALEVGKTYEWDRYFKPEANPIRATVVRRERIRVPAGTFDAVVLQPTFRTKGIFSEGGHAELWLADDSTRRVLQMKSRLSFGSLNLYLTSYTPGR